MLPRNFAAIRFAVIAAAASLGGVCLAQPVAGTYELFFVVLENNQYQPVSSLPVCTQTACEELILDAHIESSNGGPAQGGIVTFQWCTAGARTQGLVTDPRPSADCESGTAHW